VIDRSNADVVIGLALVHHLAIGRNVPLPMISSLMARLSPHLILEWIPKADPMVQKLLAAREDIFSDYTPRASAPPSAATSRSGRGAHRGFRRVVFRMRRRS
jgi:hypothetical protein